MTCIDILRGQVQGNPEEKARREQILVPLLDAFNQGGGDAASNLLKAKMNELEVRFQKLLAALEAKL